MVRGLLASARAPFDPAGRGKRASGLLYFALTAVFLVYLPARIVVAFLVDGYHSGSPPFDFGIFLRAAHAVAAGHSPYPASPHTFTGDDQYVYPPLLAFLVWPLTHISTGLAVAIWAAVGVGCVLLALWLLGVRDWRCYSVAFLFSFTRDAIGSGTVGPILLLCIATAWRFRDRLPVASAGSVAAAVLLKLFLWPLVIWLALTGRRRTATLSVVLGVVAATVTWTAIGFHGLTAYVSMLRRLSHLEALRSYSALATVHALGLPEGAAWVIVGMLGAVLLGLAARAARESGVPRHQQDARSLTFSIAAALVLSPIVWTHYLVLLLAPIALARPRLGLLWLVPLGYSALAWEGWTRDWARGDLLYLLPIVGVAGLTIGWSLMRSRPQRTYAATLPSPG